MVRSVLLQKYLLVLCDGHVILTELHVINAIAALDTSLS